MFTNLSGWHALVILTIVLLVFGSSKLPMLAKSVGQSVKILKDEVHDAANNESTPHTVAAVGVATAPTDDRVQSPSTAGNDSYVAVPDRRAS